MLVLVHQDEAGMPTILEITMMVGADADEKKDSPIFSCKIAQWMKKRFPPPLFDKYDLMGSIAEVG